MYFSEGSAWGLLLVPLVHLLSCPWSSFFQLLQWAHTSYFISCDCFTEFLSVPLVLIFHLALPTPSAQQCTEEGAPHSYEWHFFSEIFNICTCYLLFHFAFILKVSVGVFLLSSWAPYPFNLNITLSSPQWEN